MAALPSLSTPHTMLSPTDSSPQLTRQRPALWLLVIAALLAIALGLHGPIPQWAGYHAFADTRGWLGLPNAGNVLSNLPFTLIGLWGLRTHWHATHAHRHLWRAFGVAMICTGFGSALYHWAPGNGALVFDRLPIAWACALLSCALLAERVDKRWAGVPALAGAVLLGSASVTWWWLGEQRGSGDLRPYLFVQFLPMLLAPAALWLNLPASDASALRGRDWWAVLGLYAAAKLTELADQAVLDALGFTSGHTLKHLLAALAALWLLRAVARSSSAAQLR
jgi:hypothetical protein